MAMSERHGDCSQKYVVECAKVGRLTDVGLILDGEGNEFIVLRLYSASAGHRLV